MKPKMYNRPIFVDIDDTLIKPLKHFTEIDHFDKPLMLKAFADKHERQYVIHIPHIKYILNAHARGKQLFAWSGNGAEWAKKVIEAIGIEKFFSGYMTKPEYCLDDMDMAKWIKTVYIPSGTDGWRGLGNFQKNINLEVRKDKS